MICFGRPPPSGSKTLPYEGSREVLILGYGPVSRAGRFSVIVVAERAAAVLKDALSKSDWGPWRLASGSKGLDSEVASVINAFARVNDPVEWHGFWKGWDRFQTWLKERVIEAKTDERRFDICMTANLHALGKDPVKFATVSKWIAAYPRLSTLIELDVGTANETLHVSIKPGFHEHLQFLRDRLQDVLERSERVPLADQILGHGFLSLAYARHGAFEKARRSADKTYELITNTTEHFLVAKVVD